MSNKDAGDGTLRKARHYHSEATVTWVGNCIKLFSLSCHATFQWRQHQYILHRTKRQNNPTADREHPAEAMADKHFCQNTEDEGALFIRAIDQCSPL